MCTTRQLAAALAAVGIGLAATGCAVTTHGSPVFAGHSGALAAPPVAVEALDRSLLSTAEINTVMAATGMTVHTSRQNMWDDSPGVADRNCLAVDGPAEDKIYTGRGWTAMRAQVLQEPGDAGTHYVLQSVVAFPSVADAAAFFSASSLSWRACSNRRFTYTRPGPDPVWTTAQVSNATGTLAISLVLDGVRHWTCQHALTVAKRVAIDVQACAYNQTEPAAVAIVGQIAAKLADR
jgi:PknH-like extracellular domain